MAVLTESGTREQAHARRFLVLALLFASAYAIITPPFAASDEAEHLTRAYELSTGRVRMRFDAQGEYVEAPRAFTRLAEHYGQVIHGIHERVALQELAAELGSRADSEPTRSPRARQSLGPLAYVPQLAALWLARALHLPVLCWLYLARFAGMISFVVLTAWALSLVAGLSLQWLLLALTPALLAQAASASPAGLTLGLSFAFFALVLHSNSAAALSRAQRWALLGVLAWLASSEPVFVAFAVALPAVCWREAETPRQRWGYVGSALALSLGACSAASLLDQGPGSPAHAAHMKAQLAFVAHHPFATLGAWLSGLFHDSTDYAAQLLVVRDVLSKELRFSSGLMATLFAQLLFFLSCGALYKTSRADAQLRNAAHWLLASALAYAGSVFLCAYLRENVLGATRLVGVHGRALMPALPAALIVLASFGRPIAVRWLARAQGKRVRVAIIVLNVLWLVVMFGRYYAAPTWPYLFQRS